MTIDITNNIVFDTGGGSLDPSKRPGAGKTPQAGAVDSTLRTDYEQFIHKALELEDEDALAVEQARKALEAGELDTTEAAQSAAEAILMKGI
ncbi:MAG TPA: hypothetical protein HPP87_10645 [Planctomycetes bacterium]|nr:hypothetical protein [Planctomycetota bacterium]HIJ71804.1 hypothetical protein [Planctomycetota bacterium]